MTTNVVAFPDVCEQADTLPTQHSHCSQAQALGCSHTVVNRWVSGHEVLEPLEDQPGPGRPPKSGAAALQPPVKIAELPEC